MRRRLALLALLAPVALAACTHEEVMTSHNAQAPCALVAGVWVGDPKCAEVPHDRYVFTPPEDERPVPLTPAEVADMLREMFG